MINYLATKIKRESGIRHDLTKQKKLGYVVACQKQNEKLLPFVVGVAY